MQCQAVRGDQARVVCDHRQGAVGRAVQDGVALQLRQVEAAVRGGGHAVHHSGLALIMYPGRQGRRGGVGVAEKGGGGAVEPAAGEGLPVEDAAVGADGDAVGAALAHGGVNQVEAVHLAVDLHREARCRTGGDVGIEDAPGGPAGQIDDDDRRMVGHGGIGDEGEARAAVREVDPHVVDVAVRTDRGRVQRQDSDPLAARCGVDHDEGRSGGGGGAGDRALVDDPDPSACIQRHAQRGDQPGLGGGIGVGSQVGAAVRVGRQACEPGAGMVLRATGKAEDHAAIGQDDDAGGLHVGKARRDGHVARRGGAMIHAVRRAGVPWCQR